VAVNAGAIVSRRHLLAAGFVAVTTGIGLLRSTNRTDRPSSALVEDGDSLAAIGRAYLRRHPAEQDLGELRDRVPVLVDARTRADARAALPRVAAVAREDFAAGDVVDVGGWRLARTEARAAAVVALLPA
jgi:hypothetical protein